MRAIGVRRIELSGRFPLPKEARKEISINHEDRVEFFTDEDNIMVMKYRERCCICEENFDVKLIKGKQVCNDCLEGIKKGC
tara:strand:+ start:163 stop:405 length:243 start_codon:yes stop_codon:yes gene_type:complete